MANEDHKVCPVLLAIRGMQVEASVRCHLCSSMTGADKDVMQLQPLYTVVRLQNTHLENTWVIPQAIKHRASALPTIPPTGFRYPREMKYVHIAIHA